MASAEQFNIKYSYELDQSFNDLNDFTKIEERLGYNTAEKQITDDLMVIKNAVLDIYSGTEKVDWTLIQPLKIKLKALEEKLNHFESSKNNKKTVNTSTINQTRQLVLEIGELKTSSGQKLKEYYKQGGYEQMESEAVSFFDSQIKKLSDLAMNLWESDDIIAELEKEHSQLMTSFCKECDAYIQKNKNIFNSLTSKQQRLDFVLNVIEEIILNVIGPSKFKIVLGKKFEIFDTIEDYSTTLYDIIVDNGFQNDVKNYLKRFS